ncbi:MAG: methyl-accepting chemotaxis protein [Pseudomonas sp.]
MLTRFSIRTRLIALVAFSALLLVASGLSGLAGMAGMQKSMQHLFHEQLKPVAQVGQMLEMVHANQTQVLLAMQHDPSNPLSHLHDHETGIHLAAVEASITVINVLWDNFMASDLSAQEQRLADEFTVKHQRFVEEGLQPVIDALRSGDFSEGNRILLRATIPLFSTVTEAGNALLHQKLADAEAEYDQGERYHQNARNIIIALTLLAIGFTTLLAWATITGITRAVRLIRTTSGQMAEGDLTARIDYDGKDELADVASAFNNMGERFQSMVQQLGDATTQLAAAAEEASIISKQTSGNLHQQQLETQQVATATNEMSATVQEVAQNTADAARKANEASSEADTGRNVVSSTIEVIHQLAEQIKVAAGLMHQLEQHSEHIGSVLDVIRGFAEQTNLLALNAAIEAARAGEHGRGFAVVADEVRNLASHTHASSVEIRTAIEKLQAAANEAASAMQTSRDMASSGVEHVIQTGSALDNITRAVTDISDISVQIATAVEEQSMVTEEINRNITNISEMAEQTSTGAEQTAGASEELARLADRLQGLVRQFRV